MRSNQRHSIERSAYVDLFFFLAPVLFHNFTNVFPLYLTAISRMISIHLFLTLHYVYVDKDNYNMKINERQLQRERKDYLVGIILHMWAQIVLQLLFPGMFFSEWNGIVSCAYNTFLSHVLVVEPLYYAVHRWLHVPEHMKSMHGFHHMSVNTVPSTSLVQNFKEHFIYIATFGPAMLLPYFVAGSNHWTVIAAYLILFDIINAYGHTNIACRHWLFESKWSPLRYLIYTPEFHLGHHSYYNYNFGLFMPLWDHLFDTYREYRRPEPIMQPANKQDFVFIGHNGGVGHFLTAPEFSVYNVYDSYMRTFLPVKLELLVSEALMCMMRLFYSTYKVSRYLVDGNYVGRIICVMHGPVDYLKQSSFQHINRNILKLMTEQHRISGTRCFGLGNLNKMKTLNDGGAVIAQMVKEDPYLKDKNIRVWTGDTLTTASVLKQIQALQATEIFFVGANGKIGKAVCELLLAQTDIKICIYSSHQALKHPRVSYTQNLTDLTNFKFVIIGKTLAPGAYQKALSLLSSTSASPTSTTHYLLDYTVPFFPLVKNDNERVKHIQIGVLKVSSTKFLRGHYDVCMGTAQNHIYPCHAGCLLNLQSGKEEDEVGEIDINEVDSLWQRALSNGLDNIAVDIVY